MDYGRWSDRIFTKNKRNRHLPRKRETVPADKGKVHKTLFRSFVRAVFRGKRKV